jgi:ABC-type Na+ efflux pump permease subunit
MKILAALHAIPEQVKLPVDGVAIFGWVSALFGMLTGIAAFIAAVLSMGWAAIRIYETQTFQAWLKKHWHARR